ncbi:MAG: hypothetical protein ING61_14080 [Rhodocyclaceae bacterium]|nr:hypothetical protein [Rhodocyclaceae bacterium]
MAVLILAFLPQLLTLAIVLVALALAAGLAVGLVALAFSYPAFGAVLFWVVVAWVYFFAQDQFKNNFDRFPPWFKRLVRRPDRAQSQARTALGYEPGSSDLKTDDTILMERRTSRSLGVKPEYSLGGEVSAPVFWEPLRERLQRLGWGYSDLDTSGLNARITAVLAEDGRQCAYEPFTNWRRWMRFGRTLRFSQAMPVGSRIRISRIILDHRLGGGGEAVQAMTTAMSASTGIDYKNLSTFEIDLEEDNPGQNPADFPYDTWLRVVYVGFRFVVVELDSGNDWVISCVNFTHVTQIDTAPLAENR